MSGVVERALAELRAGRPVLVADSRDRENEVDVVLGARSATPEWMAWMVRHSSGYVCAPMPTDLADRLELPLMVSQNRDPLRTAYTVSVDAAVGVTTGISALDRARTLRVLDDPGAGPADLIRPGHVLPLRAVPGGVLRRAGHTEAAVDLVRLAGVGQVAAIAELVQDDGSMMRWEQAAELARAQGLVLLTIEELIGWRRAHDVEGGASGLSPARVERVATAQLPTRWGSFEIVGYRDRATGAEHVALLHPGPGGAPLLDPLVRVHSECLTGDALGSLRCDCGAQLAAALQAVASEGGAVVYMGGHEGRGIGLVAKVAAYALQDSGLDTVDANVALGSPVDGREYGAAAAILADVGWDRVRLLTNNPAKVSGLTEWGVVVSERVGLDVGGSMESAAYRRSKRERLGHALSVQ